MRLDPREEFPEATGLVGNLEFLQHGAVGQADGDGVAMRAHVDTDAKLDGCGVQHGGLLWLAGPGKSSIGSRLPTEPQSQATGAIPCDLEDEKGDGGGSSGWVNPADRATDPVSHTPVARSLAQAGAARHPQPRNSPRRPPWICG